MIRSGLEKNLGFLEKVFRFLGFLGFLRFLGFLGFLDLSVQIRRDT